MSFTAGYQSDIRLHAWQLEGSISPENIGGFGRATGTNDYVLNLDPPPLAYSEGMRLYVAFEDENEDAARINVNGLGNVPLKRLTGERLEELEPATLKPAFVYLLIYKEGDFILANISEERPENTGTRSLHKALQSVSAAAGETEQDIGPAYILPGGTLTGTQGLDIRLSGQVNIESPKTLRLRLGNAVLLSHTLDAPAVFSIEVSGSRLNADTFKGQALLLVSGNPPLVNLIDASGLSMDSSDLPIRLTAQGESPVPDGQVSRHTFSVTRTA